MFAGQMKIVCHSCPAVIFLSPVVHAKILEGNTEITLRGLYCLMTNGMLAELYCFWLVRPFIRLSVCDLSNSVIFNQIYFKFHYGLLLSTSRTSSNTGFVNHPITKMADKMAATYQYPLSWSL